MRFIYFIIIIFFFNSSKIFGEEVFVTGDLGLFNKKLEERKKFYGNPKMELILEERDTEGENDCAHCPQHLKIVSSVNKILDKMSHDPTNTISDLPIDIKKLKFMFRDIKKHSIDGSIKCERLDSLNVIYDRDLKLDGQMQLIGEQVFKFSDIGSVLINNPDEEAINYYYRSEGPEKNIIVQAIIEKNGLQRLRYFKYIPTEDEKNPYHLPDLNNEVNPSASATDAIMPTYNEKDVISPTDNKDGSNYKLKVGPTLEKRYNIPNNVHFVDGSYKNDIVEGVKFSGDTHLTLLGNKANINLNNGSKNFLTVNLETKLNGSTNHIISVPFSINMPTDFLADKKLSGNVREENNNAVLAMTLTDHNMEMFRTEVKSDSNSGKTTLLIAHDIPISKKEVYSMAAGTDVNSTSYVALKHTTILEKNTTLVLDVRLDSDHNTKLYYQLTSRF